MEEPTGRPWDPLPGGTGCSASPIVQPFFPAESVRRCTSRPARPHRKIARDYDVPGAEVLNEVTLNQVLVRFGDDDATTDAVVEAVQDDGVCWVGGTTWRGRRAMRISIVNWRTTAEDVERSAASIAAAARGANGAVRDRLGSSPP